MVPPTPTLSVGVAGAVRYYGSAVPVGATTVQLQSASGGQGGAGAGGETQTDLNGQFTLPGIGSADWRVEPRKTGDAGNAISALDAVFVLQMVVGLRAPSTAQRLACDVSGNGALSALDAVLILQHVVGLVAGFPAASRCASDWIFIPEPATTANQQLTQPQLTSSSCQNGAVAYLPLASDATDQNFVGALFGDCSGNWQPSSSRSAALLRVGNDASAQVRLGRPRRRGRRLRVPVYVQTSGIVRALDVRLRYDAMQLTSPKVRRTRATRSAFVAVNNRTPGTLAVALASVEPLESGSVLMLQFNAVTRQHKMANVKLMRATVAEE